MDAVENLRAGPMLFCIEVLQRTPIGAADQALIPPGPPNASDLGLFIDAVRERFHNRTTAQTRTQYSTPARFMDLVQSYLDKNIPRSRLHAIVCVLFIGHPDLFNLFENLRLMNDCREETRHQIKQWRNEVRIAVMTEINVVLAECISDIERVKHNPMPGTSDSQNLDFMAATRFPAGIDRSNQFHVDVMVKSPSCFDYFGDETAVVSGVASFSYTVF